MLFFKKRKYFKIIKEAEDLHAQGKLEESKNKYIEAFEDIIHIRDYIKKNKFEKRQLNQYLKYYGFLTVKKITEGGLFDAFI